LRRERGERAGLGGLEGRKLGKRDPAGRKKGGSPGQGVVMILGTRGGGGEKGR